MTIREALNHNGLNVIWQQDGNRYKIEHNGKTFMVALNDGYTDWTPRFSIRVEGKTIATRCNYRTMVKKIKNYK